MLKGKKCHRRRREAECHFPYESNLSSFPSSSPFLKGDLVPTDSTPLCIEFPFLLLHEAKERENVKLNFRNIIRFFFTSSITPHRFPHVLSFWIFFHRSSSFSQNVFTLLLSASLQLPCGSMGSLSLSPSFRSNTRHL